MYSINENIPKTKLVKIQTKNSKTKKKISSRRPRYRLFKTSYQK